ncbi:MAG: hypothetical protein ABSG53_07210 [Thermoguttaceae bacterium]|jgi:hypothetical protein
MCHIHSFACGRYFFLAFAAVVVVLSSASVGSASTLPITDGISSTAIDTATAGITGTWDANLSLSYPDTQTLSYQVNNGGVTNWVYQPAGSFSSGNVAVLNYTGNSGLQLQQVYVINSSGSAGSSNINETLIVSNTGSSSDDVKLYQYNSLVLSGSDTLSFVSPSLDISQMTPVSGGTATLATVHASIQPMAYEAGTGAAVLGAISADNLNGFAGPVSPSPASAMEWERVLGGGEVYGISQTYTVGPTVGVVPEPSTFVLLTALVGLVAVAKFYRLRGNRCIVG